MGTRESIQKKTARVLKEERVDTAVFFPHEKEACDKHECVRRFAKIVKVCWRHLLCDHQPPKTDRYGVRFATAFPNTMHLRPHLDTTARLQIQDLLQILKLF